MMLKNTQRDLSTFGYILGLISQSFAIAYLVVALIFDIGNVIADAVILAISAAYFGIYIALHDTSDRKLRRLRNNSKHAAAVIKLVSSALTLGVSVYGICISAYTLSVPTLLLAVANAAFWVMRVIVEIISYYVDTRIELFTSALSADFEFVSKPIGFAKNAIKTVMRREIEVPPPDKCRAILDRQMEREKEEKRRAREDMRKSMGKKPRKNTKTAPVSSEVATATEDKLALPEPARLEKLAKKKGIASVLDAFSGIFRKKNKNDIQTADYIDKTDGLTAPDGSDGTSEDKTTADIK